jgi:uncharacterized protein
MPVIDGRTWLEHLSPERCWERLAQVPVGRLGVLVDGAPEIYPVNHAVDERTIVFRVDPGTKLRGLLDSPKVCFEVDGVDADAQTGWSVLVKGRAAELTRAADLRAVADLPLRIWSIGPKGHWIRILPTEVTGREIHPGAS